MPDTTCPAWCSTDHDAERVTRHEEYLRAAEQLRTGELTAALAPLPEGWEPPPFTYEPSHERRFGEHVSLFSVDDGEEARVYVNRVDDLTATQAAELAQALLDAAAALRCDTP